MNSPYFLMKDYRDMHLVITRAKEGKLGKVRGRKGQPVLVELYRRIELGPSIVWALTKRDSQGILLPFL